MSILDLQVSILTDMLDDAEANIRDYYLVKRGLEITPVYAFVTPTGKGPIIHTPWRNEIEKGLMVSQIKVIARKEQATAVMLIAEAWQSRLAIEDPKLCPADCPDREEVVMAIATNGFVTESRSWKIIRRGKKNQRVTDLIRQGDGHGQCSGGRLIDGIISLPTEASTTIH